MISVNVINDSIVGSVGEAPFSVPFSKELYDSLLEKAKAANEAETMEEYSKLCEEFTGMTKVSEALITDKCENLVKSPKDGKYYLQSEGVVSSVPLPKELVERIHDSIDKGIDIAPIIKFWTRWLRNPILRKKTKTGEAEEFSKRLANFINLKYVHPEMRDNLIKEGYSQQVATERATMYQCKITQEGLLNGYKVSREILHKFDPATGEKVDRYQRTFNVDTGKIESEGLPSTVEDRLFEPAIMGKSGDAFYCEGANGYKDPQHFIRVGCVHRLEDWSKVDTNDRHSCVPGLHVGGLYYIKGYSGEIHNVFIDPMHIGAIPDDGSGAMRCLQYFVHSSLAGVNGSIYHSSKYAAKTDAEWAEMVKASVAEYNSTVEDLTVQKDELGAL